MERRFWEPYEDEVLRWFYPTMLTRDLALFLKRSTLSVYNRAGQLGLRKTALWKGSNEACKLRSNPEVGEPFRFKRGCTPWNKGLKHPPGWAPGRMRETQFKKGNHPQTWRPLGSLRYSKEGYLQRKVSDTGYTPRGWVGGHILIWREANGPVPPGHKIAFRDGDKTHIRLENLELVSNAEMLQRNSVHNLPRELFLVIQLAGALKRKVRTLRGKQAEERSGDIV